MSNDHEELGRAIARGAHKETGRRNKSQKFQVALAQNIGRKASEELKAAPADRPIGSALQEMLNHLGYRTWDEYLAGEAAKTKDSGNE